MRIIKSKLVYLLVIDAALAACNSGGSTSSPIQVVANTFAYVTSTDSTSMMVCSVASSDGSLSTCNQTALGYSPTGIAFAKVNSLAQQAYMTTSSGGDVPFCTVNSANGQFVGIGGGYACSIATTSTSSGINSPQAIFFNGNYAYLTSNNDIYYCSINFTAGSLGLFGACTATGSGITYPQNMAFNGSYAYITSRSGEVFSCSVNTSSGVLSSCKQVASNLNRPVGIAISGAFAYISNSGDGSISRCLLNASVGTLGACTTATNGFSAPNGIAINGSYLYVTNMLTDTVSKCNLNIANGTLSSCGSTGSGFNGGPNTIVFKNL